MNNGDNLFLALALVLPLVAIGALWCYARSAKRSGRVTGWRQLVVGNVLVLLALLSLLLLGGEVYYRYFQDTTDSLVFTKVSQRWFARHWRDNASGFRDNVEYAPRRAAGKRRVTFIGDSFTAGHGINNVEDRFANLLRREHPDWEIHVLALPGLDTGNALELVQNFNRVGYEWDDVVLVYCLNDICDIVPEWTNNLPRIQTGLRDQGWLVNHSFFINTLRHRLEVRRNPYLKSYFGFLTSAYTGELWAAQQQRLESLRTLITERGGRLHVVTFPFLQNLREDYAFAAAHEALEAFWRQAGVPHLDLRETLAAHDNGKLTVNAFDAHPNETAHRLAAEAIGTFLGSEPSKN